MNKNYFIEIAEFNLWANNIACSWLEQITEQQWSQEIVSSFNNIQQTVLHIISAEKAWVERFKRVENIKFLLSENFQETKDVHIALWKSTSEELLRFIYLFNEIELNSNLTFKRFNGDEFSMPYYQLFAHVINHATYHRGQLVTMLRKVGFANVQSTDLLNFYRNKI